MRFALSCEQRDFAASLRELLTAADSAAVARSWADGDPAPGRALWKRLADAGVTALNVGLDHGGLGAGAVDLAVAFVELGRHAVPGPLVESVAVLPVLLSGTGHADRLPALAAGELVGTLAAPPLLGYACDARWADACYVLDGPDLSEAEVLRELSSVDRTRHLCEVVARATVSTGTDADAALDAGTLACAAQSLGLGLALLERSRVYATQRVQFGRAIGSFQAVKHQLADVLVALEMARPLLFGAALSLDAGGPDRARDVSAAKVACAEAAYRAARTALQVHGAIGYTAEYDLSLWLTKARALYSAWGTVGMHRRRVLAAL